MTLAARAALAALMALAPMMAWAQDDAGTDDAATSQATADTTAGAAPVEGSDEGGPVPENTSVAETTGGGSGVEDAAAGPEDARDVRVTRRAVPVQPAPSEAEEEMSAEARSRADAEGLRRLDTKAGDDPLAEAADALDLTRQAVDALAAGEDDRAIELLADATGELQVLIARRPVLALAPADTQVIERDLAASADAVELLREEIEDLVDDGRLQRARELMRDFASEIVLVTTSRPLATYPDALLLAAAEIEAGRPEEALAVLSQALSTVVIEEVAIPLPPLRAEAVLLEAEALVAEPERTEEEDARLERLLEVAREQVRMGRALGYGTEDDYEAVLDAIDRIEDEAEETPVERAFARVRERLSGIFD